MSNWVEPEDLSNPPDDDFGPFHCFVFWLVDVQRYYVGHTGNLDARIGAHIRGEYEKTAGHKLELLWVSGALPTREDSQRFEAALKSYVKQGNVYDFERCTGIHMDPGSALHA